MWEEENKKIDNKLNNSISFDQLIGKTALIVEDNILNQLIAKRCLDIYKMGYQLVDDGNNAFELFTNNTFDIVLLDINIPGINGYEITKRIRGLASEKKRTVPIIAVTASDTIELIDKMKYFGMTDFLQKPYTQESLYAIMLKHLLVKNV